MGSSFRGVCPRGRQVDGLEGRPGRKIAAQMRREREKMCVCTCVCAHTQEKALWQKERLCRRANLQGQFKERDAGRALSRAAHPRPSLLLRVRLVPSLTQQARPEPQSVLTVQRPGPSVNGLW